MIIGSIARRYAKALFLLAEEQGALEQTGIELQQLAELAAAPEIAATLANPLLGAEARRAVAVVVAEQLALSGTMKNFVCLLADNHRSNQLVGIAEQYRRMLDEVRMRVRAVIRTSVELGEAEAEKIVGVFERVTGKTVLAEREVDAGLLGGVVVEVGGTVYDGSLKTQLAKLAASIAGSV